MVCESKNLLERIRGQQALERIVEMKPWMFYRPNDHGQLQFHQATHVNRFLWTGNGFGKTTAGSVEAAWWIYHSHPYQKTPAGPVIVVWCCETFKQFKILRQQIEHDALGPQRSLRHASGWKWNESDKCYTWPDGSQLFLISGDSSWTAIQGVAVDLVIFDEEPPWSLFNELTQRRRAKKKTRYIIAATATQGMTWMYHKLYVPWLEWYTRQGMTLEHAILRQTHPLTWVWEHGGIDDNPGADAEDKAYYHIKPYSSEAEKAVRTGGGFQDLNGTPVFNLEKAEEHRKFVVAGENGDLTDSWTCDRDGFWNIAGEVEFVPGLTVAGGRVTIFERPRGGRPYVIGHDSSYGINDWDYALVADAMTGKVVAEVQVKWGDARWSRMLARLHRYYNRAFLCGERQVGLVHMRDLLDKYRISYQYYDRDEGRRSRPKRDVLGHSRSHNDFAMEQLRISISGGAESCTVKVTSAEVLRQVKAYQFVTSARRQVTTAHDVDLTMSAPDGDHDDGCLALVYLHLGMRELPKFQEKAPAYEPGTAGEDMHKVLVEEPRKARRRRAFNQDEGDV